MSNELIMVLVFLGIAIFFFVTGKLRMDIVAILVIVAFTISGSITGILSVNDVIAGFSEPSVLLVAIMFVVGEGLVRTGVALRIGDLLIRKSGSNETKLMVMFMVSIGLLGSFMSSTGVVSIFIPIVLSVCNKLSIPPGRMMMPLGFGALISGMNTLIATTPNLVVNSALTKALGYDKGFKFFDITPMGFIILLAGIVYMLVGRRFLVDRTSKKDAILKRTMKDLIDEYNLHGKARRFQIRSNSPLIYKNLKELELRARYGLYVIGVERTRKFGQKMTIIPNKDTEFHVNDILLVLTSDRDADLRDFYSKESLDPLPLRGEFFSDQTKEVGMAEITLNPNSELLGKTVAEMSLRNALNINVVSIKRKGVPLDIADLVSTKIVLGDTLLIVSDWLTIRKMQISSDVIVLNIPAEVDDVAPAATQMPYAILSLVVMIVLMVTGVVPNFVAALIGCLMMGFFKCLDMESAYKAIYWPSVILIVGMLPFAKALEQTGGMQMAVDFFIGVAGGYGPRVILGCLFILCLMTGLFISNTATAVLMAPISIAVASKMGLSPYPFAMVVSLAASTAFSTPVSSPVNTLIMASGGYKFIDFVKIGLPFSLICMIISIIFVPILFPF